MFNFGQHLFWPPSCDHSKWPAGSPLLGSSSLCCRIHVVCTFKMHEYIILKRTNSACMGSKDHSCVNRSACTVDNHSQYLVFVLILEACKVSKVTFLCHISHSLCN